MNKQLRNFQPVVVYIQFHLLPCAQHAFALPVQRLTNGRRSSLPLLFFWHLALVALVIGAQGGSLEGFENTKQRNCSWQFLGGLEAVGKYLRANLRSAEPFRTVLETSALRKLTRKLVLCAKNPRSRKARTRLSHSGCISSNLKVTHHHPQEPHC